MGFTNHLITGGPTLYLKSNQIYCLILLFPLKRWPLDGIPLYPIFRQAPLFWRILWSVNSPRSTPLRQWGTHFPISKRSKRIQDLCISFSKPMCGQLHQPPLSCSSLISEIFWLPAGWQLRYANFVSIQQQQSLVSKRWRNKRKGIPSGHD